MYASALPFPEIRVQATAGPIPEPVAADLGADFDLGAAARVRAGARPAEPVEFLVVECGGEPAAEIARAILASCESLTATGRVLVALAGPRSQAQAAELRNALWPVLHVNRAWFLKAGAAVERLDVRGGKRLERAAAADGCVLGAVRRARAMAPDVTMEKFDAAAAGWNGNPDAPDYGHYRWMRRLLAVLGRPGAGERTCDAGSGAGWVGLEAALRGARLSSFDPSPAMVEFVRQNAADLKLPVDAKVGFVEHPPFDETFELVLNSGVVSFAPDTDAFFIGLTGLVKVGGRLVMGDLNPRSRGFLRRRRERPVLPVREMNGLTREEACQRLERRGFEIQFRRYYQWTWPVPELLHRHPTSRLLHGAMLQWNRFASAADAALGARGAGSFDSWIVGARRTR